MKPLIILADGSPQARRMGSIYLEDLGYEVAAVEDGAAVLRLVAEAPPRAVLAAATLPDMSGAELSRRVKGGAGGSGITFLILLGGLGGSEEPGLADGTLRKPLSSAGLQQFLQPSAIEMLRLAVAAAARGES